MVNKQFPDHQVLAEEGHDRTEPSPFRWIIDPLDGTTNYSHRFPFSAFRSRWRCGEGAARHGARSHSERTLLRRKGKGAFLNEKPISVSSATRLSKSLLVTGFAYDVRTDPINNFNHFINFSMKAQGSAEPVRRRSIFVMSPPAGSTVSGNLSSSHGIPRPEV